MKITNLLAEARKRGRDVALCQSLEPRLKAGHQFKKINIAHCDVVGVVVRVLLIDVKIVKVGEGLRIKRCGVRLEHLNSVQKFMHVAQAQGGGGCLTGHPKVEGREAAPHMVYGVLETL